MDAKRRIPELEEQIKVYLAHVVLEKEIAGDQSIIDDMVLRINASLHEVKQLKLIKD